MRSRNGPPPNNLAIETSTRHGSISVGCDDQLLETVSLTQHRRHNLPLMPTLAKLCDPNQLKEVYLNIGPGSFTGLRIAVTTAKMLAMTLNVKLVAIEAVDVLAATQPDCPHLAVCVHAKRDTVYARFYEHAKPSSEPRVMTMTDLLALTPRPLTLLGDPIPDFDHHDDITVLSPEHAQPHSNTLWHLARAQARDHQYTDPTTLQPQYARPPEAVELWNQRQNLNP